MKNDKGLKYSSIIIFLLICLTLTSFALVNGSKAKFSATGNTVSSVSTAKWDVSVTPVTQSNILNLIAGDTSMDYIVRITSNSEVSADYSIVVSNVPSDVDVVLDDTTTGTRQGNTVTFQDVGAINVGDQVSYREHKLTFSTTINSNAVTNNNINIQVMFSQKN